MRFAAYVSVAAAMVAATQATFILTANEVPAHTDAEVEADSGIYLEIEADAEAEVEAYISAGLQSGAEALAYAEALSEYQAYLMAQMQNEGSNQDAEHFGQVGSHALAENVFTDFFKSAWDEVNEFYANVSVKVAAWGDDVKEQFGKMVEEGRNLRVSTISKMISRGVKGMSAFSEMGHEYTDHCATVDNPMSFEEFFKQTTFYNGDGDWQTYEGLHKQLGEEPALDSYLTLRRDARTEKMKKEVKNMHILMEGVVRKATGAGIDPASFVSNKKNPLPQQFYDNVAKYRNSSNPFAKKAEAPAKSTPRPNPKKRGIKKNLKK